MFDTWSAWKAFFVTVAISVICGVLEVAGIFGLVPMKLVFLIIIPLVSIGITLTYLGPLGWRKFLAGFNIAIMAVLFVIVLFAPIPYSGFYMQPPVEPVPYVSQVEIDWGGTFMVVLVIGVILLGLIWLIWRPKYVAPAPILRGGREIQFYRGGRQTSAIYIGHRRSDGAFMFGRWKARVS
jgi:hypothetical protein